ncbi:coiled-coil domain-containing protein 112-like isoform X2 [Hydractinia symbiolongicarpus]|uniref:coiled-coil domain-containing protein 112-like isoform X2 n=1 Tax=Hydractinia symbiolongicarpus TaxID=13093 RepID=UPI00254AE246|nr:coiled-coil domain-containing protein 112-like isoform X2 [Hydractinia symbiolongicarpus]
MAAEKSKKFLSSDSDDIDEVENEIKIWKSVDRMTSHTSELPLQKDSRKQTKKKTKKSEIITTISMLHTHIVALEKEKRSQLYNRNVKENNVNKELQSTENQLDVDRKKEKNQICDTLEKIKIKIDKFEREKKELQKHANYLEKLKLSMEDIESCIMQFKEKQKLVYEDLMSDEKVLDTEIAAYDNKFQHWTRSQPSVTHKRTEFELNNKNVAFPPEVEEFEKFIKLTGGHQGGWDDIDHQMFLKLRKQCKNNSQLLSRAALDIPTQDEEDILQHIQWYEEYCSLRENKREAIVKWKSLKENEKKDLLSKTEKEDEEDIKRKKKEEIILKEREERFKKLQEWKVQKQLEKLQQNSEMEEERKEEERIKMLIEERKRFEVKLQVEEYRLQKKEEEKILKLAHEEKLRKEKFLISGEERERIKERNEKILLNKRQKHLLKEYEKEEKERRLEKLKKTVAVNVERDPCRLYKQTKGWKHRMKSDKGQVVSASGVRLMQHRAIPSWRQEMF